MSDTHLTLVVIDPENKRHEVPALSGWRVMEIIRDHGLPIRAECGGACACATCHVYVDAQWTDKIPKPRDDEEALLDTVTGLDPKRSRLSCQILMQDELDGLVVTLAPGSEV
jgi:2Fe-2S ferredoxin